MQVSTAKRCTFVRTDIMRSDSSNEPIRATARPIVTHSASTIAVNTITAVRLVVAISALADRKSVDLTWAFRPVATADITVAAQCQVAAIRVAQPATQAHSAMAARPLAVGRPSSHHVLAIIATRRISVALVRARACNHARSHATCRAGKQFLEISVAPSA